MIFGEILSRVENVSLPARYFPYFTDGLRPVSRAAIRLACPVRPAVASVESHDVTAGSELLTTLLCMYRVFWHGNCICAMV